MMHEGLMWLVGILWYVFTVLTSENTKLSSFQNDKYVFFNKVKSNVSYRMALFLIWREDLKL